MRRIEVRETAANWAALERQRFTMRETALVILLVVAFGYFSIFVTNGAGSAAIADSTADWLVASAFVEGVDPYAHLHELSEHFGVAYLDSDADERVSNAPRTPGALVLLAPLALLGGPEQARAAMLVIGVGAVAATFLLIGRAVPISTIALVIGLAAALVSGPARWSFLFVTQSPIVMCLVAVVVLTAMQGDRYTIGLALAVAGTLKVFPLVLVVSLIVMRRWRAVTATAVGLGVLNLIPLLMPNVSLAPMVSAMTDTAEAWIDLTIGIPGLVAQWSTSSNLLTVSLVAVATIGFASVPVVRRNVTMQLGALGLLSASLLVLPISWPHYVLTLIPVWMLIDQDASLRRPVVVLLILGGVMLVPLTPIALHTAGLVLIVIAVATQGFYARQPISAGTRTATMI